MFLYKAGQVQESMPLNDITAADEDLEDIEEEHESNGEVTIDTFFWYGCIRGVELCCLWFSE